jgi:hypothetical protein
MRHSLVFLALLALFSTPATSRTYLVRPDGTGDFPTIQTAFEGAAHGDTIELADGEFTGPGNRNIDTMQRNVVLRSQSRDPDLCAINAEYATRCMKVSGAGYSGLVVEGITMTCGYSDGYPGQYGGAVYIKDYCSPTFRNCAFTYSTAESGGGGVYCIESSPSFIDCLFKGNRCLPQQGGGLQSRGNPSPVLVRCEFVANAAWMGGGCVCYGFNFSRFTDCEFTDNVADLYGGGFKFTIAGSVSNVVLTDCRFEDNHAGEYGGGVFTNRATLQGCEFYANSAVVSGGGVETRGEDDHVDFDFCTFAENVAPSGAGLAQKSISATVTNCTFHGNSGDSAGVAIYLSESGPVFLENTIITGSLGGCGVYVEAGSSMSLACCDVYGNEGGDWVGYIAGQQGVAGNISMDPLYCRAPERDFTLHEDSPCAPFSPRNPECDLVGAWPTGCGPAFVLPLPFPSAEFEFTGIIPNPARATTRLLFSVPPGTAGQNVSTTLRLFDATGRAIQTLMQRPLGVGMHEVTWDGFDERGRPVPAGVYLAKLRHGTLEATGRVVIAR